MGDTDGPTNRRLVAGSVEKRSVREVLIAARDRIAKPGAWIQHTYARDAAGTPVAYNSKDAVCYCALGAIYADGVVPGVGSALRMVTDEDGVDLWNDAPGRTQEEVVAAFDRAIAAQDGAL
jgi:hypothetical protein